MAEQMVTISVKIPKELKVRIKRSGIKVSVIVRRLLEKETLLAEARRINEEAKRDRDLFAKISVEDVVADIREDRERR